jgi:ERF superfamily protein
MEQSNLELSFLERVAEVAHDCGYVQKLGRNEFHRYKYAAAADVLDKVNESLHKHKIVAKPLMKIELREDVTTAKGNKESRITIQCDLHLLDALGGGSLVTRAFGCGQDNGDKAVMKAQTAALKYGYMTLFNISTGDDPEGDSTLDERTAPKKAAAKVPIAKAAAPRTTVEERVHKEKLPDFCEQCGSEVLPYYTGPEHKTPGRQYYQCEAGHETKAVKGHYFRWAESWPKGETDGADVSVERTEATPAV